MSLSPGPAKRLGQLFALAVSLSAFAGSAFVVWTIFSDLLPLSAASAPVTTGVITDKQVHSAVSGKNSSGRSYHLAYRFKGPDGQSTYEGGADVPADLYEAVALQQTIQVRYAAGRPELNRLNRPEGLQREMMGRSLGALVLLVFGAAFRLMGLKQRGPSRRRIMSQVYGSGRRRR